MKNKKTKAITYIASVDIEILSPLMSLLLT